MIQGKYKVITESNMESTLFNLISIDILGVLYIPTLLFLFPVPNQNSSTREFNITRSVRSD